MQNMLPAFFSQSSVGKKAIPKQRTFGAVALTGVNNHSGKVLPEIMTIGI